MKLFGIFIRRYIPAALLFLAFAAVFAAVLSLYDLQAEAVLYASLLCGAIGIVYVSVRFIGFRRRYIERQRLIDEVGMLVLDLPEPKNAEQEQFCEIIRLLRDKCGELQGKYETDRAKMLDYFTTWVHQIKIPIAVMQLTLEQGGDASAQLNAELMRINQYVEMVLYYFRLDESDADLVARKVSVDEVIRKNVRKYAPIFIRRKLRLEYEGTQLCAVTDEKWLGFIIEQLLSNSLKYTEKGGISIAVEGLCISVSDTGIGIAPQDLPRIFDRGYTGLNGRSDDKSTGLGLYLVKKACRRIGAQIDVQSEVGKGTKVSVVLPERLGVE
ncbi:MAG: sensor histidine kinase [Ruminococcus sp.]|nr:sensor histidine kinase [Ruminococcus sp.]